MVRDGRLYTRQAKLMAVQPDKTKSLWLLNKEREAIRSLEAVLTGHNTLRYHLCKMGLESDSLCLQCGEEDETSAHFLLKCEAYREIRRAIFGVREIQSEEIQSLAWPEILTFIKRSGKMGGGR